MKLIAEKLGKTDRYDRLRFVRADSTEAQILMPRQGTLPHDLVHYVVESALPLKYGFLGLVAAGSDAGFVMQAVHDPSNPAVDVEAVQAEAIVEALQTQLWSGAFDRDAFMAGVGSASAARGKAAFDFAGLDLQAELYEQALALLKRWNQVPFRQSMELEFEPVNSRTTANR
jgi:hypothetical protein